MLLISLFFCLGLENIDRASPLPQMLFKIFILLILKLISVYIFLVLISNSVHISGYNLSQKHSGSKPLKIFKCGKEV